MQGHTVLYSLYRSAGAVLHPLLNLAAPLLDRWQPGWQLSRRFGYSETDRSGRARLLWIHAASVGEVQAARALIAALDDVLHALSADDQIFLTTMTRQGREVALSLLPARVHCELAPPDTPQAVQKVLQHLQPSLYICLETELWPVLLTEMRKAGVPMLLLNGRMSGRSFNRYQRIQGTVAAVLSGFTAVGVIREQDRERYRALGVPADRIQICGNMKYALQTADPESVRKKYRQLLTLNRETVFICGSTRTGEEKLLLPVYERLQKEQAAEPIWIIAPRHLYRLPEIQALLEQTGHRYDLFSHCAAKGRQHNIILFDCMGELTDLYTVGDFIFCGGSLVNKGGHNIMEPVSRGRPVFFGPFMQDFQDAVELILAEGAGFQVSSAQELTDLLLQHQPDSPAYRQACTAAVRLARTQQGAVRRQAEMVMRVLRENN